MVLLNDLGNVTAQHALMFNPVMAKKGITILQEAYPSRPKVLFANVWVKLITISQQAMHFLNFPQLMQGVFTMMQSFQKEKMRKRNKVHLKVQFVMVIFRNGY